MKIQPMSLEDTWALQELRPLAYSEMKLHGGVYPESRLAAKKKDGRLAGYSYLVKGPGNGIHMQFETDLAGENDVRMAFYLITKTEQIFEAIARKEKSAKVLKTWCALEADAYCEFLEELGFSEGARMLVMRRSVRSFEKNKDEALPQTNPEDSPVRKFCLSDENIGEYLSSMTEAYGVAVTESEIRYQIKHSHAEIYACFAGNEPVSFVTVWPKDEKTMTTERVFTKKDFRRKGYAETLLRSMMEKAKNEGKKYVELTVYDTDKEALMLYHKLGYRKVRVLKEMWFSQ